MLSITGELYEAAMAQLPMMPVYPDALIADTTHLSTEEFGAYALILMATWRNNGQPYSDDHDLARICRVSIWIWRRRLRARLAPFFDLSDGHWVQKRLNNEWENAVRLAEVSRVNGAKGGRPKSAEIRHDEKPSGLPNGLWKTNPVGYPDPNPDKTQTETIHLQLDKTVSVSPTESPTETPVLKSNYRPSRSATLDAIDRDFEIWWKAVPRKQGRGRAIRAYRTARKKASAETLLSGIANYARSRDGEDVKFTCLPATWLNDERWLDDASSASVVEWEWPKPTEPPPPLERSIYAPNAPEVPEQ